MVASTRVSRCRAEATARIPDCCDLQGFRDAGGGTRTPDTRIMIGALPLTLAAKSSSLGRVSTADSRPFCRVGNTVRHTIPRITVRRSRLAHDGEEVEPGCAVEDRVVRRERQAEPDRGGGDRSVAIVNLASQWVPDLMTSPAQLGAHADHVVVGLDDGEFGDRSFQPA